MATQVRLILTTAMIGMLLSGVAQSGTLIDTPFMAYPTEGTPSTAGFLRNTGHVAVSSFTYYGDFLISLYNAMPNGNYQRTAVVPLEYGPSALAYADMNGDFSADLVLTTQGRVDVMISSFGSYDPPISFPVPAPGYSPGPIAVVDLDGDGWNEVLVVNGSAGSMSVFRGDPDLILGARTDYATGEYPSSIATGDIDGDGDLDVAVGRSYMPTTLVLFENHGGAGFDPAILMDFPAPLGVTIADLDGDPYPDLGVVSYGVPPFVSVLRGHGDFTFDAPETVITTIHPRLIRAADLDRDGRRDLIVAHDYGIAVHPNLGAGSFGAAENHPTGPAPIDLAIVDIYSNGVPGIVTVGEGAKHLSVLPGNGDGTFGRHNILEVGAGVHDIATGDFDDDGRLDLVATRTSGVSLFIQDGSGAMEPRHDVAIDDPYTWSLAIGDLDQDGRDDIVVGRYTGLSVLLSGPNGHPAAPVDYLPGVNVRDVAMADFDRDGLLDVLAIQTGSLSVLPGNGDGTLDGPIPTTGFGSSLEEVVVGDLDRDGYVDAVLGDDVYGWCRIAKGASGATFTDGGIFYLDNYLVSDMALADLNRDDILDLAVVAPCYVHTHCFDREVLVVGRGTGSGTFTLMPLVPVGVGAVDVAVADLDGDGRAEDLAVPCSGANVVSVVRATTTPSRTDYGTDAQPRAVAAGDLNGDGSVDLAVGAGTRITLLLNRRGVTAVPAPVVTTRLQLARVVPNPARGPLSLSFELPAAGRTTMKMYDLAGRLVRVLVDANVDAGKHSVAWDGRDAAGKKLGTGVYLLDLRQGGERASRKLVFDP